MKLRVLTMALVAANVLIGCGGSGSGDSSESTTAPSTTLSGVASKGPLKSALVTAFPVDAAGVVGTTEITRATTTATGSYTLNLGTYSGAVQLVVTATADTRTADEATGADVELPSTFTLRANTVVAAPTSAQTQSASITPYTELAHNIAASSGGLTSANIASANGVVFTLIGVDPVATVPVASNAAPEAGATDAQKRYGLFNAAVSQLASSTPATADATTTACFAGAADLGRKIVCATQQIATAVTVTGTGSSAVASVNEKLVGLSGALVSVAADTTINKTGTAITTNDSAFKTLDAVETAAAAGVETPISGGTSTETRSDVALAKQFFSSLRANAAALQSGPVDTGIVDGIQAFGDMLETDATKITSQTRDAIRLAEVALALWTDYRSGATTNPNSVPQPGFYGGCTVYQGTFPTSIGGAAGEAGEAYVPSSVTATNGSNATWVGCSMNSGPLLSSGTPRYRQSFLFNMGAETAPAVVPWLAVTRSQFLQNNVAFSRNLTPALAGTAGFTLTDGDLTGFVLSGDLPPETTSDGTLLAARYPVDFAGALTTLDNGAYQAAFSRGKLGVVPVGGTEASLTVDLSEGGGSVAVFPADETEATPVAPQVAAAKVYLVATLSSPRGKLSGTLLVDQMTLDSLGELVPGHIKFTGEIAAAPVVGGATGAVVSFLSGSIEVTDGATPVVAFSGSLTLPNRPAASLTVSISETSAADEAYSLEGRYVQDGVTVTISGSETAGSGSITFADSTGVSTTVTTGANSSNVTVGGRQAAVIDDDANRITYSDGTFESLI